ncbi:hypothetical protein [Streptomyces mashuensis]|uniref:hypothetical protein n=1 Tax=Streptomyces mashuensis TaxID=33904 RepID=UPI00167E771C|nr:hypothetical protein [Streptomyces mashuensis]
MGASRGGEGIRNGRHAVCVGVRSGLALAWAAVTLGLAAGCAPPGGSPDGGGAAAGGPVRDGAVEGKDDSRAVRVLSAVQLRHVQLASREVPGLVVERASRGTAGNGRPTTDDAPCRPLVAALGSQPQPEPVASVVNTFARASGDGFQGLLGTIRVAAYEGDGAETTLRQLREAALTCEDGFAMHTGEGQPQEFAAVRTLRAPDVGDEAVAYRLDNVAERAPSLVTVVRSGRTLAMFFATNLADPDAVEIPEALVRAQIAKVERLAGAERPPTVPPPHTPAGPGADEDGEAGDGPE